MIAQDRERGLTFGRDQHAPACCKIVGDDVGDGVGLAGPGRSLHDHAVGLVQSADDGYLVVVEQLGEEELVRPRGLDARFGSRRRY